jgi:hypothetical protein
MAKATVIAPALAALLVVAQPAVAGKRPPPNPAISQYVEVMPTSGGPALPSGHARTKLSNSIAKHLGGGAEGRALRNVATSSAYGAPQTKLHAGKRASAEARRAVAQPKADLSGATLGAAADAVGAKRSVVLWLGLALLVIAALGAAAALNRARR